MAVYRLLNLRALIPLALIVARDWVMSGMW